MSWMKQGAGTCGRPIPKPQKDDEVEEYNDDNLAIQDQLENLRAKVSLKEKYNSALWDEYNESNEGASNYIQSYYKQTKSLRLKLMNALNSEKNVIQNALRTHRKFQVAMRNKPASVVIPWLEDRLYDMSRRLNQLFFQLKEKRKKLSEAEDIINSIVKWPRPGMSPWEVKALRNFSRLDCLISTAEVKKEVATILNRRYTDIKYHLLAEKNKYQISLKNMEAGLVKLEKELDSLETMLEDAIRFKSNAYHSLVLTEKEASQSRKIRNVRMKQMKKAVEKILNSNQITASTINVQKKEIVDAAKSYDLIETLWRRKVEVAEVEEKTKKLIHGMRVTDLTVVPDRFEYVMMKRDELKKQTDVIQDFKQLLLRQKSQLQLILNYYKYTGVFGIESFNKFRRNYETNFASSYKLIEDMKSYIQYIGDIFLYVRRSAVSILCVLNKGRYKPSLIEGKDTLTFIKIIHESIKQLIQDIEELEQVLAFTEPQKSYKNIVKHQPINPILIRVGTPVTSDISDDDDDDDEILDSKIPGRQDIKANSKKIINQAQLKKGFH